MDVFAPGANPLRGRVIDHNGAQVELDRYTMDVQGAYNMLTGQEDVVVLTPQEWVDQR